MNIAVWCADAAAHLITISAVWVLVFSMYLRKPTLILCILWRKFHGSDDFFCVEVPADVFAPDFLWKGSYHYKGQKEPLTLTVSCFNTTSGRVNATVADSSVEFLLSGETSINHLSPLSLFVLHVHRSSTKSPHAPECKLNIAFKGKRVSLGSLSVPPPPSAYSSAPAAVSPLWVLSSALFFSSSLPAFVLPHLLTRLLGLYIAGVYKRQEARLMLLRYQMRALAHSSLSRITDESWAMDGFVSILRNLCSWTEINWRRPLSICLCYRAIIFSRDIGYLSVNTVDIVIFIIWWYRFYRQTTALHAANVQI